jgi:hypothetical protein
VFVLTTMEGAVMLARTYRDFEAYDAAVVTLRDYVERLLAEGQGWAPPETSAPDAFPADASGVDSIPGSHERP